MSGRQLGVSTARNCAKFITFPYDANSVTQKFYVAPYAQIVTHIQGVPRVAGSGGACTLSFYKAASAVAVASGTILHSGSYDVVGTADTNQSLTLVTNQDTLQLAAGDAIGYALTGTPTSAVGVIVVTLEPADN